MPRRIRYVGQRVVAAVASHGRSAWLLRFSSETDFTVELEGFATFAREIAEIAARFDCDGLVKGERPLLRQPFDATTVEGALEAARERFREAVRIADFVTLSNRAGRVDAYAHHDHRSGAVVSLSASAPGDVLERTLRDLCLHVVAFRPARLGAGDAGESPEGEALLDQAWIHDPAVSVREALSRELGPEARVEAFRLLRARK